MTEKKGITANRFVAGLVVVILLSNAISIGASTQFPMGLKIQREEKAMEVRSNERKI